MLLKVLWAHLPSPCLSEPVKRWRCLFLAPSFSFSRVIFAFLFGLVVDAPLELKQVKADANEQCEPSENQSNHLVLSYCPWSFGSKRDSVSPFLDPTTRNPSNLCAPKSSASASRKSPYSKTQSANRNLI